MTWPSGETAFVTGAASGIGLGIARALAAVSPAPPVETTPEEWRRHFRVNADGQFLGMSTFLPRFLERGGRAHLLNTASMGSSCPSRAWARTPRRSSPVPACR